MSSQASSSTAAAQSDATPLPFGVPPLDSSSTHSRSEIITNFEENEHTGVYVRRDPSMKEIARDMAKRFSAGGLSKTFLATQPVFEHLFIRITVENMLLEGGTEALLRPAFTVIALFLEAALISRVHKLESRPNEYDLLERVSAGQEVDVADYNDQVKENLAEVTNRMPMLEIVRFQVELEQPMQQTDEEIEVDRGLVRALVVFIRAFQAARQSGEVNPRVRLELGVRYRGAPRPAMVLTIGRGEEANTAFDLMDMLVDSAEKALRAWSAEDD